MRFIIIFICLLFGTASYAQYQFVKDINKTAVGSDPHYYHTFGNKVFFFAKNFEYDKYNLWVYNSDTQISQEVVPGATVNVFSRKPYYIMGDYMVILASTTENKTCIVNLTNLTYSFYNSNSHFLNESNGNLYFKEGTKELQQLILTNGVPSWELIYEMKVSEQISSSVKLVFDGSYTYFVVKLSSGYNEHGLFKTSGPGLAPVPYYTFNSANDNVTSIDQIHAGEGYILLLATNNSSKVILWASDGTAEETKEIAELANQYAYNGRIYNFTNRDGKSYFYSKGQLIKADTSLVNYEIIDNGIGIFTQSYYSEIPIPFFNDKFFYSGNDASSGQELWVTDGTAAGKALLKDINPGSESSSPTDFVVLNNTLYFRANGQELWMSNGTSEGTLKIADLPSDFKANPLKYLLSYLSHDSKYYFFGKEASVGYEPRVSAQSNLLNSQLVKDVNPNESGMISTTFNVQINFKNKMLFSANDGIHGNELWMSDGTTAGTNLFMDLISGEDGNNFMDIVANDTICYFIAGTSSGGYGIWKTNGTVAGTIKFADFIRSSAFTSKPLLFLSNDKLFYYSDYKIYSSYGEIGDSIELKSISSKPDIALINEGHFIYKILQDVWISDGTLAGTVLIPEYTFGNGFVKMVSFNNKVYGHLYEHPNGKLLELVENEGSYLWQLVNQSEGSINASNDIMSFFSSWQNHLLFPRKVNTAGVRSFDLWKSDGTDQGSEIIKTISMPYMGDIETLETENLFYFVISTYQYTGELWRSDGTAAGTFKLLDLAKAVLHTFSEHNSVLYFSANQDGVGYELWKTDGTVSGTVRALDFDGGFTNSIIDNLIYINDDFIFSAYHTFSGTEYYKMGLGCDGEIDSIKSGNWHDLSTWGCGELPSVLDNVTIKAGDKIIQYSGSSTSFKSLLTEPGGVLEIQSGAVFESNAAN